MEAKDAGEETTTEDEKKAAGERGAIRGSGAPGAPQAAGRRGESEVEGKCRRRRRRTHGAKHGSEAIRRKGTSER